MAAGAYGNFLLYFTRLMKNYTVYQQNPRVGAGLDKVPGSELSVRGLIQTFDEGAALNVRDSYSRSAKSAGTGEGVASVLDEKLFWTEKDLPLQNYYVIVNGKVYRFLTNGNWNDEAGFFEYVIHMVVGNNGAEEQTVTIIDGSLS